MDEKIQEIIQNLEKDFNGDINHDVEILRNYCRSLERTEENLKIVTYIGRYASEKFPEADAVKEAKAFEDKLVEFQEKVMQAQTLMREKKFEDAVKAFDEIIGEVQPPKDESKYICSFNHPFEEMLFRARNKDKPIEKISNLPEVLYYQKGCAWFELKDYDKAEESLNHALELSPVNTMIFFELMQIARIRQDYDKVRELLKQCYQFLYTRHQLARFYREHAALAMLDSKFELANALIYLSMDYEDTPQVRAQLNSLAKNRGVDLSKPKVETVKQRLSAANIPVGPDPAVYGLAIDIGNQTKKAYPEVARMAYGIAYDITHYEPLLRELQ
ncbi:MAG: tetratricopeptide repeat protein [Proteobacteria bacterium]|nr:tetratricopeptide repeat protein [Pseudomonadota bacterium]